LRPAATRGAADGFLLPPEAKTFVVFNYDDRIAVELMIQEVRSRVCTRVLARACMR
jgi:hypothetical protein